MKHNGFVGIGIDPSARLHVENGSASTGTRIQRWFDYSNSLSGGSSTVTNDVCAIFVILEIQPKTYNYIDVVNRGEQRVYGSVAQLINEVLPEAVAIQKYILPNIYQVCDCSLNKIYVNVEAPIDTKIDIIDLSGNRKTYIITEITENYITIDKEIMGEQCFVYSYEVDDFHTIDKSYIFTLNVCATQELQRKITTLEEENIILKEKLNIIMNYLNL
jgi:hypothetical protein